MPDEAQTQPTTGDLLSAFYKELVAKGLPQDLAEDIVRDTAYAVIRDEGGVSVHV
jgi:hypothetical protein